MDCISAFSHLTCINRTRQPDKRVDDIIHHLYFSSEMVPSGLHNIFYIVS